MRKIIYDILNTGVPEMNGGFHSASSIIDDEIPARPFAVIHMGVTPEKFAGLKVGSCTIWIHDEVGSYTLIDQLMKSINAILDGVTNRESDTAELMSSEFQSESGDLYDPGFRTATKNITFKVIGKEK